MITFFFEPRPEDVSWSSSWRPPNPTLNASDFCLKYFKADLRLEIHGVDLSVRLLGEPVVDIALMLDHAKRELETRSDAAVESSLTQHAYSFSREGTAVSLATEWPLARAELTWFELQQLTDQAKAEAFRLITTAHPELRDNAWLRDTVGAPSTA